MATRRRRVKHSHNKTRTTSKALLRKTTYKNKKSKHHKTKKVYQSGGVSRAPKASTASTASTASKKRAKGASGIKAEPKTIRYLIRKGIVPPDTLEKYIKFQKENPTAEFDIPIEVSGLPYNISVKSVKRKTPGQNSFTIMCGDARRFINGIGSCHVPYHMVIAIRQPHRSKPGRQELVGTEIDLRSAKKVLFGNISDDEIKKIVEASNELTEAYYKDSTAGKQQIDYFNAYLKGIGSKLQLAPKKENPEKGRDPRVQVSFPLVLGPEGVFAKHSRNVELSSQEGSPQDMDDGNAAMSTGSRGQKLTSSSRATPRSRGTSARSRGVSSRSGVSKKPTPTPQVIYYRSFKPRERGTTQLQVIPEELPPTLSALPEEIEEIDE